MSEKIDFQEDKHKNRKLKKLYNRIKKQMEFYFSDSNLVKDKFLMDLVSQNSEGFVEIDVFKKFNKIKALTNSTEVIANSVARSDFLQISEDHKKVRRITPLETSKDFDACTLYVEKLPPNADQKWVKDVLGQFGTITYVNVPRFKVTNKIKGFAFVEFESPEGVKNACEFYKIVPEKECSASEDENKNVKNKKNRHEETLTDRKNKKSRIRSISESSDKVSEISTLKSESCKEASDKGFDHNQHLSHQKGKRKRENSVSEIAPKKPKESTDEDPSVSVVPSDEPSMEQSGSKAESNTAETGQQITTTDDENTETSNNHINGTKVKEGKNKRKRKHSKKHHSNLEKPVLKVMPKSEWKSYRTKYLALQRATMSLLKKQILYETQELKEQENVVKSLDLTETKKTLQFTPGVIIKVNLTEPVKNPTEIKTQVKANAVVAYVDAPAESSEIFIRCHNSEDAQSIMKEDKFGHIGKAELLEGDDEKKYWEKLEMDRKNKFNNPVSHKKRGRDKLLAKAAKLEEMKNKHIYFDD